MSEADITTKKSISQPPLDLLFNPSVLSKKDVWEIDISLLLEMLLKLINNSGKKDLRMCGIACIIFFANLSVKSREHLTTRKNLQNQKGDRGC